MLGSNPAAAQGKQLTLCWAAWDPANALVELGKDFTKASGIEMKYEFVPWTSYADRFVNELNSHGTLCDLIIGDSQWIGGSAENKHYVKLNDFFAKEHISMDDFMPATVLGYAEWPKNSPNYWALPAMADAVGWTYRKDWFAKPELRDEFKEKFGRDLEPPKTWDELLEVSKFFTGKEIDGKKVYGSYIFTERGSEGITMGVTNAMYNYGFDYMDPKKPYHMTGVVNSPGAAKGLDVYKELFQCCQPPGLTNAYMQEGLDAFKSGQVAMQMNWYAFFPGLSKDPNVGGDKIGFFVNPAGPAGQWTQLGGQGLSVVAASKNIDDALLYVKWFAQPAVQQKWTDLGGASASVAVLESDAFKKSASYAPSFVESMHIMKDFWAEPLYIPLLLDMQNRVHDYVVANKGTSQEALDALVKDWKKVLKQEG
ncbi:MAG: extracellular solute-binding protein, partial [Acetobacteraceae bacterium]|nr:extracellular solute-binding protein [Acetobacteraceae bacterium]